MKKSTKTTQAKTSSAVAGVKKGNAKSIENKEEGKMKDNKHNEVEESATRRKAKSISRP